MTNRETFLANIKDLDHRREAERLYQLATDAAAAWVDALGTTKLGPDGDASIAHIKDAMIKAENEWVAFDGYADPVTNKIDVERRCALTGLFIHDGDPVMTDEATGEIILKAALGIPLNIVGEFDLGAGAPARLLMPEARLRHDLGNRSAEEGDSA